MSHSGFNPKARWDRHFPEQEPDDLSEKIWVSALFRAGKIIPRYFIWKNKLYRVKKTTYSWQERQGRDLVNFFSIDTGADLYQISFSPTRLSWRLERIM